MAVSSCSTNSTHFWHSSCRAKISGGTTCMQFVQPFQQHTYDVWQHMWRSYDNQKFAGKSCSSGTPQKSRGKPFLSWIRSPSTRSERNSIHSLDAQAHVLNVRTSVPNFKTHVPYFKTQVPNSKKYVQTCDTNGPKKAKQNICSKVQNIWPHTSGR